MLRHTSLSKSIVSLSLAIVLFSGCGPGDGFSGGRGTVDGKITFEGAPVPKGTEVMFVGVSAGYIATATVRDNGAYSLKFNGSTKLPAIKYQVQISPPAGQGTSPQKGASANLGDPADMTKMAIPNKKSNKTTVETGPFPVQYWSIRTSKLDCEVKPGPNSCDFDLKAIKAK